MVLRFLRSLRKHGPPILGWSSAALYLIVATGLPLPMPISATKDRSIPFPCMDRACGCRDAEQCWESCCCHTQAERVAWARARGVTPPPAFVAALDVTPAPAKTKSCCAPQKPKSCCSTKTACCSSHDRGKNNSPSQHNSKKPTRADIVVGMHALACHGSSLHWLAASIAMPPVPITCDFQPAPTGCVVLLPQQILSIDFPPPVPPPRPAVS